MCMRSLYLGFTINTNIWFCFRVEYEELQCSWVELNHKVTNMEEAVSEMVNLCNGLNQQIPKLDEQQSNLQNEVQYLQYTDV